MAVTWELPMPKLDRDHDRFDFKTDIVHGAQLRRLARIFGSVGAAVAALIDSHEGPALEALYLQDRRAQEKALKLQLSIEVERTQRVVTRAQQKVSIEHQRADRAKSKAWKAHEERELHFDQVREKYRAQVEKKAARLGVSVAELMGLSPGSAAQRTAEVTGELETLLRVAQERLAPSAGPAKAE
jgi:hypothetical protein